MPSERCSVNEGDGGVTFFAPDANLPGCILSRARFVVESDDDLWEGPQRADKTMTAEPITDETARAMRASWFAYLDTVEPLRKPLHAYGLRLTGNVWDAEDLVQDTLLKEFAMIGRGDLHGLGSPVANPTAYLFRTATNLWIDVP